MKLLKFIYLGFVLTAAACSESDAEHCNPDRNIQLSVAIGDIDVSSRAETDPAETDPAETDPAPTDPTTTGVEANPYRGSMPSAEKPFETAIWFRKDGGVYKNNTPTASTGWPVSTSVKFTGPQLEYVYYPATDEHTGTKERLKYPIDNTTDDNTIYCVGFYPKDGWTTDGVTVSHPIDGQSDLMFAAETVGTWDVHFAPLVYEHLLTWVKIAVCATSHDTAEAWGKIKKITITGKKGLKIDLKKNGTSYEGDGTSYEGDGTQTVKLLNSNDSNDPVEINTTMREVGSIFCSPETSYTLTIETTNNTGAKSITLDLLNTSGKKITNKSDAQGQCFVLSLYLKPYNVIEGECSLNAWDNQNEDIYF